MTNGEVEVEIKLRMKDAETSRKLLEANGFSESRPRIFESNAMYDTPGADLRARGENLRLRQAGDKVVLTWKGKAVEGGQHKVRPEIETGVADYKLCGTLLGKLGYREIFHYQKFRTEFSEKQGHGTATLDETPIGVFVELEGPAEWIDEVARRMGFTSKDYVTATYGSLYLEYCRENLTQPDNMLFK